MSNTLSYGDAISALTSALKFGMNPGLDHIKAMCAQLGNPQERYRCVQVAGTNGKSSTARFTAALIAASGAKVGLYTSPHLVRYPERIEVGGTPVPDALFAGGIEAALDAAEACGFAATEFELLTAAALWVFAQEGVEWAVLECGLGGRWDATSVVSPQVAVITGVSLEHTAVLGDTVEKIAAEKAAIIKPGCKAVLAYGLAARKVFELHAEGAGVSVVNVGQFDARDYVDELRHLPSYQDANVACALAAAKAALGQLPPDAAVRAALAATTVPGRFETLREEPLLMIDAAHNPQSAAVLASELQRRFVVANAADSVVSAQRAAGRKEVPTLLLGVLADKDVRGVVAALCPLFRHVVVTQSQSPRAISAQRLARIVKEETGRVPDQAPSVSKALAFLEGERVIAAGSITLAGEVKRVWC